MKKLLFLFMLIGAALQLKAQSMQIQPFNNFQLKPFNNLPDNFYKKYLYTMPDSVKVALPQYQQLAASDFKVNTSAINYSSYDHMPIVRMEGRSNMPIVKMDGHSNMPVKNLSDSNKFFQLKTTPKP
jgi:hypothetical protein